jgi:hypothetical protein
VGLAWVGLAWVGRPSSVTQAPVGELKLTEPKGLAGTIMRPPGVAHPGTASN